MEDIVFDYVLRRAPLFYSRNPGTENRAENWSGEPTWRRHVACSIAMLNRHWGHNMDPVRLCGRGCVIICIGRVRRCACRITRIRSLPAHYAVLVMLVPAFACSLTERIAHSHVSAYRQLSCWACARGLPFLRLACYARRTRFRCVSDAFLPTRPRAGARARAMASHARTHKRVHQKHD